MKDLYKTQLQLIVIYYTPHLLKIKAKYYQCTDRKTHGYTHTHADKKTQADNTHTQTSKTHIDTCRQNTHMYM